MTLSAIAQLDLDVADRQAFGLSYVRPRNLDATLARYWGGTLRLPPQPDWNGEFTDWAADPFKDRNWQFQHHTLRWVNPLRWAAIDGDREARMEWLRVARSWFDANVPASDAVGAFAWKDMADGNRAIQFALGAPLVPDDAGWFIDLLEAHRAWLMDDANIVGGNHGLHQNAGLLVTGAVLRDAEAMEKARNRMVVSFDKAFDEEGCNREGSTAYHQMNIRWWTTGWSRVAAEGLEMPTHVTARMEAACEVLAHLAQPDGELPQIGDSARSKVARGLSAVTDFVATGGKSGTRPSETMKSLSGGYAISRSGWGESRPAAEESQVVIRHGYFDRAHGHRDSGSVHLYTAGRRWLTDPGFHSYQTGDATRNYLASRAAHNVPLIVGVPRDETVAFELARATSTEAADDFLLVDHGYEGVTLERRVTYLRGPDAWLVWDRASSERSIKLEQHWQVDVGLRVRYRDRGFRLYDSARHMTMTWLGGDVRPRRHDAVDGDLTGWIGTRWKTLEKGSRLTASTSGKAVQLAALVGAHSPEPLAVIDSYVMRNGILTASLLRGGVWWVVAIDGDAVSVDQR